MMAPADRTDLPWLVPCAGSLAALARSPATGAWELVRDDPGAVLLVLRHAASPAPPPACRPSVLDDLASCLHAPDLLEDAARILRAPFPAFVDWSRPPGLPSYHTALAFARVARRLAEITRITCPETAWCAGLLAPLGWLASCVAPPPESLPPGGLARHLARCWQFPPWLAAVTGQLGLPAETVRALGADLPLFYVTQLAVTLVHARPAGNAVHLAVGASLPELADALKLTPADLARLAGEVDELIRQPPPARTWTDPHGQPLLGDVLELAAENRRLRHCPAGALLEREAETLHRALEEQRGGETERLRRQKLNSIAELAAGAGHEINNPLAVISGQAQYLLYRASETDRVSEGQQKALQTIIQQCQDIHQILRDLRLFARPPLPRKERLDLSAAVRQAATGLGELASKRTVQLLIPDSGPGDGVFVHADPAQVETILSCLLRNAVEAAPAGGWAGVRLDRVADRVEPACRPLVLPACRPSVLVVVEDNGPGPEPRHREHLFDPFFSGRQAGRGTGLGLSIAWALARQHDGDVHHVVVPGGPTRFVLTLPADLPTTETATVGLPPVAVEPPTVNGMAEPHLGPAPC
jgi:signal transduction histidine kinase